MNERFPQPVGRFVGNVGSDMKACVRFDDMQYWICFEPYQVHLDLLVECDFIGRKRDAKSEWTGAKILAYFTAFRFLHRFKDDVIDSSLFYSWQQLI